MKSNNTVSLDIQRVVDGRAWYRVIDRDGQEVSAGWQKIAWRGAWQAGMNAHNKTVHFRGNTRKKPVHQTKA